MRLTNMLSRSRFPAAALALLSFPTVLSSLPVLAGERPTCFGRPATIVPRRAQERVVGTPGNDVIVAIDYTRRTIFGLGGDDVICGGRWADVGRAHRSGPATSFG
jgi:hypothetical protein